MHKKLIISGGGTGGHIYPAIAIAQALQAEDPAIEVLFIGALGRMEMEKVPAYGYRIEGLPIRGIQRKNMIKNIQLPWLIAKSIYKTYEIFRKFSPDAVIGVGGYASWAAMQVAAWKKIPIFIQEQNSYPGIVNRIMKNKAIKIFTAYPEMEKYFPKEKIMLTGNPVRKDIRTIRDKKQEACLFFQLSADVKTVLFMGGSLGAETINRAVAQWLSTRETHNVQIIWQTGKPFYEHASRIASQKSNVRAYDFISRMDLAYAMADVVISRAGALSIAEIAVAAKPAIFVPSPNVAEDHQTKNAMALVRREAAWMVSDQEAVEKLPFMVEKLLHEEDMRARLSENIAAMAFPQADVTIAKTILQTLSEYQ